MLQVATLIIILSYILLTIMFFLFCSYRDSFRIQPAVSHSRMGRGSHHRLQHAPASGVTKIWGMDSGKFTIRGY
jgi:hypothetical protein